MIGESSTKSLRRQKARTLLNMGNRRLEHWNRLLLALSQWYDESSHLRSHLRRSFSCSKGYDNLINLTATHRKSSHLRRSSKWLAEPYKLCSILARRSARSTQSKLFKDIIKCVVNRWRENRSSSAVNPSLWPGRLHDYVASLDGRATWMIELVVHEKGSPQGSLKSPSRTLIDIEHGIALLAKRIDSVIRQHNLWSRLQSAPMCLLTLEQKRDRWSSRLAGFAIPFTHLNT
jgi:hypothetical protein